MRTKPAWAAARRTMGDLRRRWRAGAAKRRLRRRADLEASERDLLAGVSSRVGAHDAMYGGDYFEVGLSALRCVDAATEAADLEPVRRILDLACGHGRVMRFLAARHPQAQITACDVDADALAFCASAFGATSVRSDADLASVSFPEPFDLIWSGSLVTHLDRASIRDFLALLRDNLRPGGLAVFSTHGDGAAGRLRAGGFDYLLAPRALTSLAADYEATGYGYADYASTRGYGVSLTAAAWMREQIAAVGGLEERFFAPRGWDSHQDVFGLVRAGD